MDLEQPSKENMTTMIEWMKTKLRLVNTALFDPDDYRLEDYDELYDLYRMMQKRDSFTSSEMSGILEELGALRKRRET